METPNFNVKNKITYVTCIYDDLYGTELGGRPHPLYRYFQGIESSLKLNCPFVIFTWPKDVERVKNYYINFLGQEQFDKRIRVLSYDLYDTPIREIIKNERPKNNWVPGDRCIDVMFGKYYMLLKSITENFFNTENFFWIDAGLSHSVLFPQKHMDQTRGDKKDSWCNLFTEKVSSKILELSKEKIFLVKMSQCSQYVDRNHTSPNWDGGYIIGGLFGGNKEILKEFSEKVINSFLYHIKELSILYFEEQIMTIVYSFDQDKFNTLNFDEWAHENTGEWAQANLVGRKSFYKIFEELNFDENDPYFIENEINKLDDEIKTIKLKQENLLIETKNVNLELNDLISKKLVLEEKINTHKENILLKELIMKVSSSKLIELLKEREDIHGKLN
jgi:hypothetical protein